jgi:hypothetical protein
MAYKFLAMAQARWRRLELERVELRQRATAGREGASFATGRLNQAVSGLNTSMATEYS